MALQLKRANALMHSQQMASIAPTLIGCNDYLAYGTIFMRAMFRPKIKLDVVFLARKAVDERWGVVVVVLQIFCPSQRNQPPSMGGLFVVHFLSLCCG